MIYPFCWIQQLHPAHGSPGGFFDQEGVGGPQNLSFDGSPYGRCRKTVLIGKGVDGVPVTV